MSNSEKFIKCSFCSEEHPSSTIADHLKTCGNKTEQCPNCEKYIRRAIFAYHYENNCAQFEDDDSTAKPATTPKANQNVRYPDLTTIDSNYSNRVKCRFCSCDCEFNDINRHEEACLENRRRVSPRPSLSVDSNEVPCQICNTLVKFEDYDGHLAFCIDRYQRQPVNYPNVYNNYVGICQYCGYRTSIIPIICHEVKCSENPVIKKIKRYASNIPFLQNRKNCSSMPR